MYDDDARRAETLREGWMAPLEPNLLSRSRMRRAILERARPLLLRRRVGSWQDVAAGWAALLAPAAALLALAFAGVAYVASAEGGDDTAQTATVEELIGPDEPEGPPSLLTATQEPNADMILTEVMYPGNR
ncbi:MAG: hypothetical protein ACE5HQ_01100 [Gemmatimonadota bacterium]